MLIDPGTELTISFVGNIEAMPFAKRQELLMKRLGFVCQCERCTDEQFTELDYLLIDRISADAEFIRMIQFAESLMAKSEADAWKFYRRAFEKFGEEMRVFDVSTLSFMDRVAQLAVTHQDWRIGRAAAARGLDCARRLVGSGLVWQTCALEFRFVLFQFLFLFQALRLSSEDEVQALPAIEEEGGAVYRMFEIAYEADMALLGEVANVNSWFDVVLQVFKQVAEGEGDEEL